MSNAVNEFLGACRPFPVIGRGDKHLANHAQELRRLIAKAGHRHPEFQGISDRLAAQFGVCLAEMAEDLHNDIGIWRALEQVNRERYQTPLPFLAAPGDAAPAGFDARRFQYYLYALLRHAYYQSGIRPRSPGIAAVAEAVSRYCREKFAAMPLDSGVKKFLGAAPKDYLVMSGVLDWFGPKCYLFRPVFDLLVATLGGDRRTMGAPFSRTVHTVWGGLKPIECLARVLSLSEAERQDLLGWGSPLPCGGEVVAIRPVGKDEQEVVVRSLLSGREHSGRAIAKDGSLATGRLGRGDLASWRGEPHWDYLFQEPHPRAYSTEQLTQMRQNDAASAGARILALCPELGEGVRQRLAEFHQQFVARHNGALAVVRTGREAVELWLEQQRAIAPAGDAPTQAEAATVLPEPLFEAEGGVGVHSDPRHGLTFNTRFDDLLSALKQPDGPWTEAQVQALSTGVIDHKINPALTRKLAAEHGKRAFLTRFNLAEEPEELAFEWLLDTYRGGFRDPDYVPFLCVIPPAPA